MYKWINLVEGIPIGWFGYKSVDLFDVNQGENLYLEKKNLGIFICLIINAKIKYSNFMIKKF